MLPFLYRGKISRWKKLTKFWLGDANFFPGKLLLDENFKVIAFPKSIVKPQKYALFSVSVQRSLSVCLTKIFADILGLAFTGQTTFFRNFENSFKIILIGEYSFTQMYRNKISFLT